MADETTKTPAHELVAGIVEDALKAAADEAAAAPQPPQPTGEDEAGPDDDPSDQGPDPQNVDWDVVRACADEPETDIGNARRFLKRHGETVLSIEGLGWAVHDARRWAIDYFESEVRPLAHHTVELIRLEAAVLEPRASEIEDIDAADATFTEMRNLRKKGKARSEAEELRLLELDRIADRAAFAKAAISSRRSQRMRYGKTSSSSGKMDNMLKEARVYRSRPVRVLDAEPMALNLQNGTLRLVKHGTGDDARWKPVLGQHRKDDLISKLCEVEWDIKATAPEFHRFLIRIIPDDKVRAFLQRYLGYCITALTTEQVFAFFYGAGRNGKSTLVDVVCRILGDYSTTVPFETLAGDDRRKGSEATPDLVRVPGARLVRASEPEAGMKFRESMVKSLTSGEPILIRRMREEFIEVYPTFKLVISGNHRPDIRGGDEGIWRRVLLVPFTVQIPKTEIDRGLPEKLWAERAGILNWLVDGACNYLAGGLEVPPAVRAATDDYREQSDPYSAFLTGACDITKEDFDTATPGELYEAFVKFCKGQGFYPVGISTFNKALPERTALFGFNKAKSMGLSLYRGIRVRDEFKTGHGAGPSGTPEEGDYGR